MKSDSDYWVTCSLLVPFLMPVEVFQLLDLHCGAFHLPRLTTWSVLWHFKQAPSHATGATLTGFFAARASATACEMPATAIELTGSVVFLLPCVQMLPETFCTDEQ